MKGKIIEILKSVLETSDVNDNTSQTNCANWDSMHHLMIVVELESQFNIQLQPEEIESMKSVPDILKILSSK